MKRRNNRYAYTMTNSKIRKIISDGAAVGSGSPGAKVDRDRRNKDLVAIIQKGEAALQRLEEAAEGKIVLSKNEMSELEQAHDEGEAACTLLIELNQGMINDHAGKKFFVSGRGCIDTLDLIQEARIGLVKAAQKFDLDKDGSFYSYASTIIRHRLSAVLRANTTIHVSSEICGRVEIVSKKSRKLSESLEQTPSYEEIAEAISNDPDIDDDQKRFFTVENVKQYVILSEPAVALDKNLGSEGDSTVLDFMADEAAPGTFDVVYSDLTNDFCVRLIMALDPDQREALRMERGLSDNIKKDEDAAMRVRNATPAERRSLVSAAIHALSFAEISKSDVQYLEDICSK